MIQDLEAANEELQSANEEILSANEELQSTNEELDTAKEELQSTNEELNTVNEELQARNEELSRVNSDLVNLLGSVQIAIVMVTNDLRIRRFTPMAERVLNLIPTDVGRPISDIKPNIDCDDLEVLIAQAIDSVSIRERECRDRHGHLYVLRIRPYKNVDNRIDGAVLALFDMANTPRGGGGGTDAEGGPASRPPAERAEVVERQVDPGSDGGDGSGDGGGAG
jgi:two-component system CheB/CheR fusion protein